VLAAAPATDGAAETATASAPSATAAVPLTPGVASIKEAKSKIIR
jgi:hypothetical protein